MAGDPDDPTAAYRTDAGLRARGAFQVTKAGLLTTRRPG